MVRNTAREIAIHLSYQLNFTREAPEKLLEEYLSPEHFAELAEEDESYRELPNPKQRQYISRLVTGVAQPLRAGRLYREIRCGLEICPDSHGGRRHHAGGHV